jgi:hypothetical protein
MASEADIMSPRRLPIVITLILGALSAAPGWTAEPPESLVDLSLEVDALLELHKFRFTPAQREALANVAAETADKTGPREETANAPLRRLLLDLRKALLEEKPDNDRIDSLEEKVNELRDSDDVDLDDDVEITDAARRRAPELARLLGPRQLTAYWKDHAADIPDPEARLLDAIEKATLLADADWQDLCEDITEELGWALGGIDKRRAGMMAAYLQQWLNQVRFYARSRGFSRVRPELEKGARQIGTQVAPMVVLNNYTEQSLAQLLSNPRLAAALDARARP